MAPKKRRSSEVSPNRELEIKPISRIDRDRRITRSLSIKEGGSSSPSRPSSARKQASASKKKGKKPIQKPPQKKPKKTPKTDDADDDSDETKSYSDKKNSDSDDKNSDSDDKNSAAEGSDNDGDDGDKNAAAEAEAATEAGTDVGGSSSSSKTTIIIEHCKQCQSFKRRANEARAGLEKSIPGINVLINPDKPRKGCFEIRAEDGKAFVSLQDLKRPFKEMKDLDMDEVVADIVKEIGE